MSAARPPAWTVPALPAALEPAGGWWTADGAASGGASAPAGGARAAPPVAESGEAMRALAVLAAELATLKRVRDAQSADSVATRLFRRAWEAVLLGQDVGEVALSTTADALAALRMGAMDSALLSRLGIPPHAIGDILVASFDEVSAPVPQAVREALRAHVGEPIPTAGVVPGFVEALIRQPRAGATCPGKPRIILEPQEGHGDHCLVVAVLGVVLAGHYGARPAVPFLAGLAHHLHNAVMPDSGFAGEMLLGGYLVPAMERVFAATIEGMPRPLGEGVRLAMRAAGGADTPEGRAFNAADVIDRIMEMRHFANVAGFTTEQALGEMELVHVGPLQAFHHEVMREAGLMDADAPEAGHAPGSAGERGAFDIGDGVVDAVFDDGDAPGDAGFGAHGGAGTPAAR
ncbi:MAG: hypothetical protein ACRYGC_09190 [Janthinobacterium lividum]